MQAVMEAAPIIGMGAACKAMVLPRSTYYRRRDGHGAKESNGSSSTTPRKQSERALDQAEKQQVLDALHCKRFIDKSPGEVYATLLDEGVYLCSERTMYRILAANKEVRERRNQRTHPVYTKPQLHAVAPNQVWSWDITKLKGAYKWIYLHLYVMIDIFSRYVVGWMVAPRESAELAKKFIQESCEKQHIQPGQLDIHADRGTSMTSKCVADLLTDLAITKSHSRPHVSNDNPYSESQFKTLKYRPDFPLNFGGLEDARAFCNVFFDWYNNDHRHSGISMLTPAMVHFGEVEKVLAARTKTLTTAYNAHPERFIKGMPAPKAPPAAAWINPPDVPADCTTESH
jgi:putative transposase